MSQAPKVQSKYFSTHFLGIFSNCKIMNSDWPYCNRKSWKFSLDILRDDVEERKVEEGALYSPLRVSPVAVAYCSVCVCGSARELRAFHALLSLHWPTGE